MKTPVDQSPEGPDPQGLDAQHASDGDAQRQAQTTDNIADLRLAYARIREALEQNVGVGLVDARSRDVIISNVLSALKAAHLIGLPQGEGDLSARVRRLVIAARVVAYSDGQTDMTELDQAAEAFAADIPWENGDDA